MRTTGLWKCARCDALNSSTAAECTGCGKNRTIAPPSRPSRKISELPGAPGSLLAEAQRLCDSAKRALAAHERGDADAEERLVELAREILRVTDIGGD